MVRGEKCALYYKYGKEGAGMEKVVKYFLQFGKKIYNFVTKSCGEIYNCVLS